MSQLTAICSIHTDDRLENAFEGAWTDAISICFFAKKICDQESKKKLWKKIPLGFTSKSNVNIFFVFFVFALFNKLFTVQRFTNESPIFCALSCSCNGISVTVSRFRYRQRYRCVALNLPMYVWCVCAQHKPQCSTPPFLFPTTWLMWSLHMKSVGESPAIAHSHSISNTHTHMHKWKCRHSFRHLYEYTKV